MNPRTAFGSTAFAFAIALLPALGGAPAIAGPFDGMSGNWSGSGHLSKSSGSRERLRCRANNSAGQGGNMLNFSIRCASDSFKFDLTGYIQSNNGAISGQWSEPNYNSAGTLSGRASGSRVNALAIGNTFSARISMNGGGNRMTVSIRPEATEIRQVSLSFSKR
jgi:hypothetical protein